MDQIQQIPLDQLYPSEGNRRVGGFDQSKLEQLAESIRAVGVQQPAVVRRLGPKGNDYEIVAGERRWRAAKIAGLEALPCVVRDLDDVAVIKIQTIENLQREDIHPLDEADGYARLIERAGYDVGKLAGEIGKSASYVYQRLKLRDLVEPARKMLVDGEITAGHAILIARLPAKQQEALLKGYLFGPDREPSVRDLDEVIHRDFLLDLSAAGFRKDDADLVPKAGACTNCPKRTGFQPELFADVCKVGGKKRDYCTDPPCFNGKLDEHLERQRKVLEGKDHVKIAGTNAYGRTKEKGVLQHWDTEPAKKGEPGAKLALVVSGDERGKTKYVKPKGKTPAYRVSPEEKARVAREDLEYTIERELPRQLVKKIAEARLSHIDAQIIPADIVRLLLDGFRAGDDYWFQQMMELNGWGGPEGADEITLDSLNLTPERMLLALLEGALLQLAGYNGVNDRLKGLADELSIDMKALKKEICQEIKEEEKTKAAREEKAHA